jgi:shikimate kinase
MNIYLIGMMGSGKTTAGKKLARKLSYQFVDLDEFIEEQTRLSVSDFFLKYGEDKFRLIEQECLRKTFEWQNMLVSTGGGTPCFFSNMEEINKHGISVYIKATAAFLASRLLAEKEKRPLISHLQDKQLPEYLSELLLQREKYYCMAGHIIEAKDLTTRGLEHLIKT